MFGKIGVPELLIVFGIAMLIFGPRKIGELGKGLGEGLRQFKGAIGGLKEPLDAVNAVKDPMGAVKKAAGLDNVKL
ncbi:MAG TPA: twin-arginine translocase TatA/TatE family subunit [Clostridia bacterium]|nr:twin-arginine translocase TatA/TatE family subunit [Clostridia bacterium]